MKYIKLNYTDIEVSPVCLGTVNYGTAMTNADSKKQLSDFLEMGGNFIDSAHIYGDWGGPNLLCRSERVIGEWLKETGNRDKVVLATKGSHPDWGKMEISRLHAKDINKDLNESLEYLYTDYIDLYLLHRDDPNVEVSEIIDCLDAAQKAGKIKHYGCSNWSLSRMKEAQAYAKETGKQGFVVNQLMWSLADINFYNLLDKTFILLDEETLNYHIETGMNVMSYMSIAKAYFQRRYNGEVLPNSVTDVYGSATNDKIYEKSLDLVNKGDYSFMDLSFQYLAEETRFPSVPIASFDNYDQLDTGIESFKKPIPKELIDEYKKIKKFVYWK